MTRLESEAPKPTDVWLVARRITFVSGVHTDVSVKCCPDEASAGATVRLLTQELQGLGQAPVALGGQKVAMHRALQALGITGVGFVVTKMPLEGVVVRPRTGLIIAPS